MCKQENVSQWQSPEPVPQITIITQLPVERESGCVCVFLARETSLNSVFLVEEVLDDYANCSIYHWHSCRLLWKFVRSLTFSYPHSPGLLQLTNISRLHTTTEFYLTLATALGQKRRLFLAVAFLPATLVSSSTSISKRTRSLLRWAKPWLMGTALPMEKQMGTRSYHLSSCIAFIWSLHSHGIDTKRSKCYYRTSAGNNYNRELCARGAYTIVWN
jgi:hypothetical protein